MASKKANAKKAVVGVKHTRKAKSKAKTFFVTRLKGYWSGDKGDVYITAKAPSKGDIADNNIPALQELCLTEFAKLAGFTPRVNQVVEVRLVKV